MPDTRPGTACAQISSERGFVVRCASLAQRRRGLRGGGRGREAADCQVSNRCAGKDRQPVNKGQDGWQLITGKQAMTQAPCEQAGIVSRVLFRLAGMLFAQINRNSLAAYARAEFDDQALGTDRWHKASWDKNAQAECEQDRNREQRFACLRLSDPCVHGRAR